MWIGKDCALGLMPNRTDYPSFSKNTVTTPEKERKRPLRSQLSASGRTSSPPPKRPPAPDHRRRTRENIGATGLAHRRSAVTTSAPCNNPDLLTLRSTGGAAQARQTWSIPHGLARWQPKGQPGSGTKGPCGAMVMSGCLADILLTTVRMLRW